MSLVSLGSAAAFALLAYSTVTSTGKSVIYGDMGIYPGTAYTGFPPAKITGDIYSGTADAGTAQGDALLAYADAASQGNATIMSNVDLGGLSLSPGVYKWDAAAALSSGDLYLDAGGDEDAVWIFQIGTSLNIAAGSSLFFTSGLGTPDNVFWQVGSSATINGGCAFIGNVVAYSSISLLTGATVLGHLVGMNGAITMISNTVSIDGSLHKSSSDSDGLSEASIGIIVGAITAGLMAMFGVAFVYRKRKAAEDLKKHPNPKAMEISGSSSIKMPDGSDNL